MVEPGLTTKGVVPMDVPPVAVVNTLYVTPVAGPLALIVVDCPAQIVEGVAVTEVAAAGGVQAVTRQC